MAHVVINFDANAQKLLPTIDLLVKMGALSEDVANEWKKSTAAINDQTQAVDKEKKSVESLTAAIESVPDKIIDEQAKQIIQDTGKATDDLAKKTIKLTTQLRGMKQELSLLEQAGKQNSARYRELAIAAGKLEDQIGDTSQRVRHLASDTRGLDTALSLASGVAGGFSVAQGAAALFGSENEELQKTLLKVQAALAIVNGLQAVAATVNKDSAASVNLFNRYLGQSTGAMKAFKIAAAGLAVGLIVFAVMEAYKAWQKYSENVERAKHTIDGFGLSTETFNDIQQRTADGFIDQKVKLEGLLSVARDHTIALDDRKKALKEINEISPKYLGDLTLEKLNTDEATAAIDNYLKSLERKAKAEAAYELLVEKQKELFSAQAKQAEDYLTGVEKFGKTIIDNVNKGVAGVISYSTLGLVKVGDELDNIVDKAAENTANNRKQDEIKGIEEDLKSLTGIYEEATKEVIKNGDETEKTTKKTTQAVRDIAKSVREEFTDTPPIQLFPTPEQIQTDLIEPTIEMTEEMYDRLAELQDKDKERWLADMELRKQKQQEYANFTTGTLSNVFAFAGVMYENDQITLDEQLKNKAISQEQYEKKVAELKVKQAKLNKARAIAETIMNTAMSIIKTNAELGLPAAIPFDILAGVMGLEQIAIIAAQKIPAFAKGTRSVEGGTPGRDSVLSLLMPGERVETAEVNRKYTPILDAIHDQRIPASFLNSIAEMPDFNALSVMLGNGMPVPVFKGIDYDLMAEAFGKHIEKLPIAELHFDEEGIYRTVRNGSNKTTYLNQRYN